MLCQTPQPLAYSTRFLSQQRNVLATWAFYTFPAAPPPPLPVSISPICCFLFFLPSVPVCLPSFFAFANTCLLLPPALFRCYRGERRVTAPVSLFPLSFPFFLIVLQVQRWFPGFLLRATHSDKCISYTGNQHF